MESFFLSETCKYLYLVCRERGGVGGTSIYLVCKERSGMGGTSTWCRERSGVGGTSTWCVGKGVGWEVPLPGV